MDGYIGEIRGFAGTFNPSSWMFCQGQPLPINAYNALYAILGTTFGGDGVTNFKLPDLRGRAPIGAGVGAGLSINWILGQASGAEKTQLALANLPVHTHTVTTSSLSVAGTATGTISQKCLNDTGGLSSPGGNVMGNASGAYSTPADADATMAPIAASLTLNGTVSGTVTVGNTGGSQPINNIQPVLGINWIICVQGMYPTRD